MGMLVNSFTDRGKCDITPIPGTRIIDSTMGIIGATFQDVNKASRVWTVHALYTPVTGRAIGGVRAKVVDQKGFVSFCNQRDLEVLLQLASAGSYCEWLDQEYVDVDDRDWIGLALDGDDLLDDLFDRELEARAMCPPGAMLPSGMSFERLLHDGEDNDYAEVLMLMTDTDPMTGMGPDLRFDTVERRWVSVERTPTKERSRLWSRR